MTWEEKLAALQTLCNTSLRMRAPGDWYVAADGREVQKTGSCVLSGDSGDGTTPQEAVEDDWKIIAEPGLDSYVVLDAMDSEKRREVQWIGYMWKDRPVQSLATRAEDAFIATQKKKTFAASRTWRKLYVNPKVPWPRVQQALEKWWELHKELNLITERKPFAMWEEEGQ